MASSTSNCKPFQPISSDSNANPNNMRSTGAIPKTKTIQNGISPPSAKLNNNHEVPLKTESNGSDTQCLKNTGKTYSKSATNGFKSSNGLHNGLNLCSSFRFANRNNHGDDLWNGLDAGPSTSRGVPFIGPQLRAKDSDSEYSSDTGNDDLSCSDECCIYTYKGDVADLPSSFLNLDLPDNNDAQDQSRAGSRGSSPEMDFLEMDFDPGPSCDADSDESSINSDIKIEDNLLLCEDFETEQFQVSAPEEEEEEEQHTPKIPEEQVSNNLSQENSLPTPKKEPEIQNVSHDSRKIVDDIRLKVNLMDEPWVPKSALHRTLCTNNLREAKGHHSSSGDLISPNENLPSTSSANLESRVNTSSSLYHSTMEKQLVLVDKQPTTNEEEVRTVERIMIWTEQEAVLKQITQIGTSACGATAVLNVLLALNHPVPTHEKLLESVATRLRANSSPLIPYLKSRSVAGSTHKDLIRGLANISNGQIYARFFHMYPERYINLSQWLSYWIQKGAVPIATLNLQKGVKSGNAIPDAWHHQMIFGVGPHGIYLTNPLERVEEGSLWHQLSSESVLLVRREDAISRWDHKTNLRELMAIKDVRWHDLNVVGQLANVIREHHKLVGPHAVSRTHLSIPASYSAGITLAINITNPAYEVLKHCSELPTLNSLQ